jgi:hypothetical protein
MRGMTDPAAQLEAGIPHSLVAVIRDTLLVAMGCVAFGLAVNAMRPNGIPLVQRADYEILVPCPETSGEVEALPAEDVRLRVDSTLLVDVVFDYLEPTPAAVLRQIAASGAQRVAVYGDGGDPDSGEQLARELSGKGIKNVGFVVGGAPVLRAAHPGATP